MNPLISLSNAEAKAIALDALGFAEAKPQSVLEVFERAHYMPLFSRLGIYQKIGDQTPRTNY